MGISVEIHRVESLPLFPDRIVISQKQENESMIACVQNSKPIHVTRAKSGETHVIGFGIASDWLTGGVAWANHRA